MQIFVIRVRLVMHGVGRIVIDAGLSCNIIWVFLLRATEQAQKCCARFLGFNNPDPTVLCGRLGHVGFMFAWCLHDVP